MSVAACSVGSTMLAKIEPQIAPAPAPTVGAVAVAEPSSASASAGQVVGQPYQIAGNWYYPQVDPDYDRVGEASWYGPRFHGRRTANGEIFNANALTAAHPTLPLPSYVRVTNLENQRSMIVRVNDRGPYLHDRLIDVSERTAEMLGFKRSGRAEVRVEYIDAAEVDADDERFLLASYRGPGGYPEVDDASMLAADSSRSTPRPRPDTEVAVAAALRAEAPVAAPTQSVAFAAEDAGSAEGGAFVGVQAATSSYQPDDRIFMVFDVIEGTGQ